MIYKDLDKFIASARKERNEDLLRIYQLIKTEMVKAEKDGIELNDINETKILLRMISERKDSIAQYISGHREDLASIESSELNILQTLVPNQPSEEDIDNYTRTIISAYKLSKDENYKLSMKDMKPILTLVQEKYPTVDGGFVSKILRSIL